MGDLNRRGKIFSILTDKQTLVVNRLLKDVFECGKSHQISKKALASTRGKIVQSQRRLANEYSSEINIETIQSLNQYIESLHEHLEKEKQKYFESHRKLKESKRHLNKARVKENLLLKIKQNNNIERNSLMEKKINAAVQDDWLLQRAKL